MLFQQIALLSAIAATTAAVGVSENDVPLECRGVCSSLVSTTQQCDLQTNDDLAELTCICNSSNAGTIIPTCDACVAQFRRPDDRDDDPNDDPDDPDDRPDVGDVRELLTRCNLSTIAYSSGVLSSFPTPTGGPGAPGGSGGPVVVTSGTAAITLAPPTPTGGNGQGGNGQGGNNNLPQPVAQGGAPAQTATIGAALALGAFGMVMALL